MNKHRKLALAVLASITIAGIAGASASSLGGVNTAGIGADTNVTSSCDVNGVNTSYTTAYSQAAGGFVVSAVKFSSVNTNCNGKAASVVLADSASASIADGAATPITLSNVSAGNGEFSITLSSPVAATAIENISLVIQG